MKKKIAEFCGWIGVCLIHGSTLPTLSLVIVGNNPSLPHISLVLMIWTGLALFNIRSIVQGDILYIVSNSVGFFFQTILLAYIVL